MINDSNKPDWETCAGEVILSKRNDLFDWRAGCKTVVHDTHALRTLTKRPPDTNIRMGWRELPLGKLEKLGEMIAELRGGSASDG